MKVGVALRRLTICSENIKEQVTHDYTDQLIHLFFFFIRFKKTAKLLLSLK